MARVPPIPMGTHPEIYLSIEGGDNIGHIFEKIEWRAMVNAGYVLKASFADSYWNVLRKLLVDDKYLQNGRKKPTRVVWELIWPGSESTGKYNGYLINVDATGINTGGTLSFTVIDPPTYWLNAGDSSGKSYKGSVKSVIEQVLNEYYIIPNGGSKHGSYDVSNTLDNVENRWYMMRMDPKTFINSLVDWAAGVSVDKTNFMISSDGYGESNSTIVIKEQSVKESVNLGMWIFDTNAPGAQDAIDFNMSCNTFLSVFQKQLITSGISATTENYMDRITDIQKVVLHIDDIATANKKNVIINQDEGFAKPNPSNAKGVPHEWSTSIISIPEHSGGDLGVRYSGYVDGRARNQFLSMLNMVMRMKLRITGEPMRELNNAHNLGVSKVNIAWQDADLKSFTLGSNWLVNGYHHVVRRDSWYTYVYLNRLDWDALAQIV